ncbi:MAG: xanthine dehydrogenase family protein molybdopterin-binding subunit, partial [Betaproteobacteria bacterium]|nr:xanthine dehydrogenase family protein molybdopterin-binding subunit [Betaproteobacteria bacterium]
PQCAKKKGAYLQFQNTDFRELANVDTHTAHHGGRLEDFRLVTGAGMYTADWNLPGQLHACFVRSDRAHAEIVSIDVSRARQHAGVERVYTGEDALRAGYDKFLVIVNWPGRGGEHIKKPARPSLAVGKVRHVGDAVAMIVADSPLAAQDAAELVTVEYRELPAVVTVEEALADGAPQLHGDAPGNLAFDFEGGSEDAAKAAMASAAHVTRARLEITRVAPSPLELRASNVQYDAQNDAYHVYTCIQGINMLRKQLAFATDVPEDKIIVHAQDVGGSFGQRSAAYPEHCMQMLAAKELGKPVKWVSTRAEGFMTDTHGRANTVDGELALDRDGKFLALRVDWLADMGAYLSATGSASHTRNPNACMTGVYRIPALYGRFRLIFTNTVPVAAYRGAGRPDIAYVIERLVSQAAAELRLDPAELRRRNFLAPQAFPYKTPTGSTYENADMPAILEKALKLADWKGFPKRRAQSEKQGKLRGIGIATVIENTGAGLFPKDQVAIECGADGTVTAYTVAHSSGQGHETTFAMVIAGALGIPLEKVRLREGIQSKGLIGNHTGGSRSLVGAGSVCKLAAQKLIEQGRSRAAEELDVEPSQVEYSHGSFHTRGSKKKVKLADLAKNEPFATMTEASVGSTFPNGCHIAEVEIDPETGTTRIASYNTVDDAGNVINHSVVEGQVHGAVVQGAGQIFCEKVVYDPDTGQLMTGSFMDYCMPRAGMLPDIHIVDHPLPSGNNSLGAKGVGESGCTASLPALANAMMDALRPLGVQHLDMPFTPTAVWHAIRSAKRKNH